MKLQPRRWFLFGFLLSLFGSTHGEGIDDKRQCGCSNFCLRCTQFCYIFECTTKGYTKCFKETYCYQAGGTGPGRPDCVDRSAWVITVGFAQLSGGIVVGVLCGLCCGLLFFKFWTAHHPAGYSVTAKSSSTYWEVICAPLRTFLRVPSCQTNPRSLLLPQNEENLDRSSTNYHAKSERNKQRKLQKRRHQREETDDDEDWIEEDFLDSQMIYGRQSPSSRILHTAVGVANARTKAAEQIEDTERSNAVRKSTRSAAAKTREKVQGIYYYEDSDEEDLSCTVIRNVSVKMERP